jgi:hypothetical protein
MVFSWPKEPDVSDAVPFLLTPEFANEFHKPYDDIQKPPHEEQVSEGTCQAENEH